MRTHERSHFYKFMTVNTALAVLRTSSLRYSSPSRFNDPFDHQIVFTFPFTEKQLADAMMEEMLRVISDDSVVINQPTMFGRMMLLARDSMGSVSRELLIQELLPGVLGSASVFKANEQAFNDDLRVELNRSRVLCVTEEIDNVVMWSHYADEHKGVAFRLECIDEIDNTLLVAKPMKYTELMPTFPPLTDYIRHLTGEAPIDLSDIVYSNAAFTKHKDWEYEREWRVHVPHNELGEMGYSDWKENPRIFGAIYFGCRIDTADAQNLMRVIEEKMPHVEVHQAKTSRTRFGMEFERLK